MNATEKKKSETSTKNSNVDEKYVYFAIAKEWRKVSPENLQYNAMFNLRLNENL